MANDELRYPTEARTGLGRRCEIVVWVSEDNELAIHVPAPGTAVIPLDRVDQFIDAIQSVRSIAAHQAKTG